MQDSGGMSSEFLLWLELVCHIVGQDQGVVCSNGTDPVVRGELDVGNLLLSVFPGDHSLEG